jgi:hypothetical protein
MKIANHSEPRLKMNLQYFSEEITDTEVIMPDDDVILPDEEVQEPVDEVEETKPTEQQQEEERQAFLRIKYNKEELELDEEKARELAQKGLNYDKVQERLQALESDPRLSLVEQLAKESNMTVEEWVQAVHQQREQARLNELIEQNIPEDIAKEMLENRKFREQYESKQKEEQARAKQEAEYREFFQTFPDVKADQIPGEVWEAHQKGKSLVDAYTHYENKRLKEQLAVLKQNEENAKRAPVGSVTQHGTTEPAVEDDFLRGFNSI